MTTFIYLDMYITGLTLVKLYILNKMCYGIPASLAEYALWRGVEYTCGAVYNSMLYLAQGCPPSYDETISEDKRKFNDRIKHDLGVISTQPNTPPDYNMLVLDSKIITDSKAPSIDGLHKPLSTIEEEKEEDINGENAPAYTIVNMPDCHVVYDGLNYQTDKRSNTDDDYTDDELEYDIIDDLELSIEELEAILEP